MFIFCNIKFFCNWINNIIFSNCIPWISIINPFINNFINIIYSKHKFDNLKPRQRCSGADKARANMPPFCLSGKIKVLLSTQKLWEERAIKKRKNIHLTQRKVSVKQDSPQAEYKTRSALPSFFIRAFKNNIRRQPHQLAPYKNLLSNIHYSSQGS